jgi:hypothetical protein
MNIIEKIERKYFYFGLFNDAVNRWDYVVLNGRMINE